MLVREGPSAAGAREVVDLWCEAQPFRDHVTSLMRDTGLHWRLIAALAEISPTAVHHLLHGRDGRRPKAIHVTLARSLMQVDTDDLLAAKTQRTTAKDSRELLRALMAQTCDFSARPGPSTAPKRPAHGSRPVTTSSPAAPLRFRPTRNSPLRSDTPRPLPKRPVSVNSLYTFELDRNEEPCASTE